MSYLQNLPEDEEEITLLPPYLHFIGEISNIKRASGSKFITYNYNMVI